MTKPTQRPWKGKRKADGSAYNARQPVPPKPRVKKLPESWRVEQRHVAMKTVSSAAFLIQEKVVTPDTVDSFRNSNLIARIATEPDDAKAQQELDEALQRRAAG